MDINITTIPGTGATYEFVEKADRFPVLSELGTEEPYRFSSEIAASVSANRVTEEVVEIQGVITTTVTLECGRCLVPFETVLKKKFRLTFSKDIPEEEEAGSDEEIELSPKDIETEYLRGDIIHLKDHIQEQVIMALPQNPLCNDTCKGLCQQCGANLNASSCDCVIASGHPAFAVLQALTKK